MMILQNIINIVFIVLIISYLRSHIKKTILLLMTVLVITAFFYEVKPKTYTVYQKEYYTAATISAGFGWVSAKYETSGYNSWYISSGAGDYGGKSYGIPQFTSKGGGASINSFMNWLEKKDPAFAAPLTKHTRMSSAFDAAWRKLGKEHNTEFATYQMQYSYNYYTAPFIKRAKQKFGVDLSRSWALLEMAHSTAVQFGSGGTYALGKINSSMSDAQIIKTCYRNKIANVKTYFRSSSAAVQNGVRNRFIREEKDVLSLIGKQMSASFIDLLSGETSSTPLKKPDVDDLDLTTSYSGDYKKGYLYSRFATTLLAEHINNNERLDRNENYIIRQIFKKAIDFEWANGGKTSSQSDSSTVATESGPWSSWRQGDPKWKGISLGGTSSIGRAGCLATSVAIQIKRSGTATPKIPDFNPGTFVKYLNSHGGFSSGNFKWNSPSQTGAAPNFKLQSTKATISGTGATLANNVKKKLNEGCYMVMRVKYGEAQHWVAVIGAENGKIQMADPASDSKDVCSKYSSYHVCSRGRVIVSCYKKTD